MIDLLPTCRMLNTMPACQIGGSLGEIVKLVCFFLQRARQGLQQEGLRPHHRPRDRRDHH